MYTQHITIQYCPHCTVLCVCLRLFAFTSHKFWFHFVSTMYNTQQTDGKLTNISTKNKSNRKKTVCSFIYYHYFLFWTVCVRAFFFVLVVLVVALAHAISTRMKICLRIFRNFIAQKMITKINGRNLTAICLASVSDFSFLLFLSVIYRPVFYFFPSILWCVFSHLHYEILYHLCFIRFGYFLARSLCLHSTF